MNRKTKYNIVIVSGFGGSGSTAVVDLLSEFDTFKNLDLEFRLLVDPDGIMNLENALVYNWTPYQSDIAIKRFKRLINILVKKNMYPYFRDDFIKKLGKQFEYISNEYLNKLVSFKYKGMWVGINNPIWWLKKRFNVKFIKINKPIYISFPQGQFIQFTREYLDKIFQYNLNFNTKNIVIDEGYASLNPNRILNYFYSTKMIIVHRDPRDTYVNMLKEEFDFIPKKVESFIKWYEFMQLQSHLQPIDKNKVLRIYFEDLVLNYEKSLEIILKHLFTNKKYHVNKKLYFNPDISVKNIGIWKDYKKQDEIKKIYKKLKNYCYR